MNIFNQDSESYLVQRIKRLEMKFDQFKRDILFAFGLAFTAGFSDFLFHALSHA